MKKLKYSINLNKELKYKNLRINDDKCGITKKILDEHKPNGLIFTINDSETKAEHGKGA